jgi:serine/threonine-protein kinase HipA
MTLKHLDFRGPGSTDYSTLLRLTRFLTKSEVEIERAFRHCVFNVIFNNRDDHPKNFSFCLDSRNRWKLAPAYDLTFNPGPGGEHFIYIAGESRQVGIAHLLSLAEEGGLVAKSARQIIDEVVSASQELTTEAQNLPIRQTTTKVIAKSIEENVALVI